MTLTAVFHDSDIADALCPHAVDLKSRSGHLGSGGGCKELGLGYLSTVRADHPHEVVSEL
jgi:hypothetical protein